MLVRIKQSESSCHNNEETKVWKVTKLWATYRAEGFDLDIVSTMTIVELGRDLNSVKTFIASSKARQLDRHTQLQFQPTRTDSQGRDNTTKAYIDLREPFQE